jgi:hypothetical protein
MNSVIFENILNKDRVEIDLGQSGQLTGARIAAYVSSSDMGPNSDRGQDFGWRLDPKQRAIAESYQKDAAKRQEVSDRTGTPLDALTITDFIEQLLHEIDVRSSAHKEEQSNLEEAQADYRARVEAAARGYEHTKSPEPDVEAQTERLEKPEATAPAENNQAVVNMTEQNKKSVNRSQKTTSK